MKLARPGIEGRLCNIFLEALCDVGPEALHCKQPLKGGWQIYHQAPGALVQLYWESDSLPCLSNLSNLYEVLIGLFTLALICSQLKPFTINLFLKIFFCYSYFACFTSDMTKEPEASSGLVWVCLLQPEQHQLYIKLLHLLWLSLIVTILFFLLCFNYPIISLLYFLLILMFLSAVMPGSSLCSPMFLYVPLCSSCFNLLCK